MPNLYELTGYAQTLENLISDIEEMIANGEAPEDNKVLAGLYDSLIQKGEAMSESSDPQTYWLEEKKNHKTGMMLTTVYRESADGTIQRGEDRPFASWWGNYRHMTDGLFSAHLEPGLEVADAARLLRAKREEAR